MKNKIPRFLTAVLLALSLAACVPGGDEDTRVTTGAGSVADSESVAPRASGVKEALIRDTVRVGDTIVVGRYEQDNNPDNGPEDLHWIVLDKQPGRVLVMTRKCIDQTPYYCSRTNVTWQDSTLRSWLNSSFLDDAFTYYERQYILHTVLKNEDNPQYGTDGGADTQDDIFVLSVSEAQQYFASDELRRGAATAYTAARGAFVGESFGTSWWWLRTPGEDQTKAALVNTDGAIVMRGGERVNIDNDAVRPAMWLYTDMIAMPDVPAALNELLLTEGAQLVRRIPYAASDAEYTVISSGWFQSEPERARETLRPFFSDDVIREMQRTDRNTDMYAFCPLADQTWIGSTCRIDSFDAASMTVRLRVNKKGFTSDFFSIMYNGDEEWDGTWQSGPRAYAQDEVGIFTLRYIGENWKLTSLRCGTNAG